MSRQHEDAILEAAAEIVRGRLTWDISPAEEHLSNQLIFRFQNREADREAGRVPDEWMPKKVVRK